MVGPTRSIFEGELSFNENSSLPVLLLELGYAPPGRIGEITGQDDRPALVDYDDGATCTVMISMSLYLWCWTEEA